MISGNSPPNMGALNINNRNLPCLDRNLNLFVASENPENSSPSSSHYSSCRDKLFHHDDSDYDNNNNKAIGYFSANSFGTPTICSSFGSCNDYFLDSESGSLKNMSFHEDPNFEGYETEGSRLRSFTRSRKKFCKNLRGKGNLLSPENNIRVWSDRSDDSRIWCDTKEDGELCIGQSKTIETENTLVSRNESATDGCGDLNTGGLQLGSDQNNRDNLSLVGELQTSESNLVNNDNFEVRTIQCVEHRQPNSLDCSFGGDFRITYRDRDKDRQDVGVVQLDAMESDWQENALVINEGCSLKGGFACAYEGEVNGVSELEGLHHSYRTSASERLSDFDSQSEFDSMLGDATDEEDDAFILSQRNRSFCPGTVVKETNSDYPFLLNSEVVFGASDWDEFAEEVRGNDLFAPESDVDIHCHEESRSIYSKRVDSSGAYNLKVEDFGSSMWGVADKLVYEDVLTTPVQLGGLCTSRGSGRPNLEEDDRQEILRPTYSVQTVDKFRDSKKLSLKRNNYIEDDTGISSESANSSVDLYMAEDEKRNLPSEKPHIEALYPDADTDISSLKASLIKIEDSSHEKELECICYKEEAEEEKNCTKFDDTSARPVSNEKAMSFISLSDAKTNYLSAAATENNMEKVPRIEVNGESFIPMASRSGDIHLGDTKTIIGAKDARDSGKDDLGPDELSRYFETLDVNESYIDTVHDMEDVLLDSGGSNGGIFGHTNRGLSKQSFRGCKDEDLGASTSGADSAYQQMQYTLKLDWIEVVGAKQRMGGASLGERLVGVKEYTVYQIRVHSGRNQWEIERRYRDFLGLYRQLKKMFSAQGLVNLPSPWELVERESRKIFGNASPDVISERSILLQECLQSLLRAGSPFDSAPPLFWFLLPQRSYMDTASALTGNASEYIKRAMNEKGASFQSLQALSPSSHTGVTTNDYRNGDNGKVSSFGKTIRLIVQIHPHKSFKQLLEEQHYSCAGCYKHLDIAKSLMEEFVQTFGWGKPRLCEYMGQLFCTSCHSNETAVLPARVLQHWDFTPRPVSQLAKAYLDSIYDQPMLCVSAVNPFIFSKVPVFVHVMEMRKKLSRLLSCIQCPSRTSIQRSLRSRRYLLENNDFFALRDLVDLSRGAFAALPCVMEALSKKVYVHITQQCSICREVGELCGAQLKCEKPSSLIFPFQEGEVIQCNSCGLKFHQSCFRKLSGCQCSFIDNIDDTNGKSPLCGELDVKSSLESGSSSNSRTSNISINKQGSTSSKGFLIDLFQRAIPDNILKPKKKSGVLNMASLSGSLGL